MTVAILYICTGRYVIFWDLFYKNIERYFLPDYHKEYFVFTDASTIPFENQKRVHKVSQKKLGWPYDTLLRFKIFLKVQHELEKFDYIFFLNANMQCVDFVNDEILPVKENLLAVLHPGFYNKSSDKFTLETNPMSKAFNNENISESYFMGGFNGGKAKHYLELIKELDKNIDIDIKNNIIAVWHDESHLNNYLQNKQVKILSPSYGYPQDWNLPFEPKIIILNKENFGGHKFMREKSLTLLEKLCLLFRY